MLETTLFATLKIDKVQNRSQLLIKETKGMKNRCKAWTKAGKPCRAAATAGGLCFFHANPNKASELGRIGGRSKRHAAAESGDPLPPLDTVNAVVEAGARLYADARAGKVSYRDAASLVPLLNLQMQAIKTADLEPRLANLEQQSKLRDSNSDEPAAARDQHSGYRAASGEIGEAGAEPEGGFEETEPIDQPASERAQISDKT